MNSTLRTAVVDKKNAITGNLEIFKFLEQYNMQNYYHKEECILDPEGSKIRDKFVNSEADSSVSRDLG